MGLTAKLSRTIDLEIENTAQGEKDGTARLSLAWVCLWPVGRHNLSLSHTHSSKRDTLAARGVWWRTYTHTHTQRTTLISCLALLSSEWHSWGDRAILWTAVNTNKHTVYSVSLPSLVHTFTTFYRQTPTGRKVCHHSSLHLVFSRHLSFCLPFRFH